MDVDTLRFFQQVADGATVTEVAELYQVSQPGVSRGLKRLEDEVGTPLLQRAGRLLRTTYAGSVFKRHVDVALHALDDGLAAAEELIDPETGTVRVAFQLSLGTWFVPGIIAGFRRRHPGIRFRFKRSDDSGGSSLVAEGRTELEFTARRPHNPEVHWERLFREPLHLAVPPDHRFVGRPSVDLAEAASEDFVMLRRGWQLRALTDDLCARANFTPRVTFEEDDVPVVRGFVAAGLGVAVVPAAGGQTGPSPAMGEQLVPLTDAGAFREVGLSWSITRRLLPSAEIFRAHVVRSRQHPYDPSR